MAAFSANPLPGSPPVAETLESLGRAVAQQYQVLEQGLMQLLADAIRKGVDTEALVERVAIAVEMQTKAQQLVDQLATDTLAQQVIQTAAAEGDRAALAQLGLADSIRTNYSAFSPDSALGIASISAQLQGGLAGIAPQILRGVADRYRNVVANVTTLTVGGAITRYEAQREATRQLLAEGLPSIDYSGGRRMPIGSYVEMATRTATNRAWQEATVGRLAGSGVTLVTIVVGIGACKACAAWSGRILSTNGVTGDIEVEHATEDRLITVHVDGTLQQARAHGWNHPNCRCTIAAYFPGLRAAGSRTTYDPDAEAARVKLRSLERGKRAALLEESVAPDDLARVEATRKVRQFNKAIGDHIGKTGLIRQRQRESLIFTGERPQRPRPAAIIEPKPPRPAPAAAPKPAAPTDPYAVLGPKPPTSVPAGTSRQGIQDARQALTNWEAGRVRIGQQVIRDNAVAPLSADARRAAFADAKNAAEVGKLLGRELGHRGIAVSGFTNRQSVETAREYANTVADLLDEYPMVNMTAVKVGRMSATTYAHASSNGYGEVEMTLNTKWAADREGMMLSLQRDAERGFHPPGFDNASAIITHEFGHIIDSQNGYLAGSTAANALRAYQESIGIRYGSREAYDWQIAQLPGYAFGKNHALNGVEAIAEAFADVRINGTRASAANQALTAHLLSKIGVTK